MLRTTILSHTAEQALDCARGLHVRLSHDYHVCRSPPTSTVLVSMTFVSRVSALHMRSLFRRPLQDMRDLTLRGRAPCLLTAQHTRESRTHTHTHTHTHSHPWSLMHCWSQAHASKQGIPLQHRHPSYVRWCDLAYVCVPAAWAGCHCSSYTVSTVLSMLDTWT